MADLYHWARQPYFSHKLKCSSLMKGWLVGWLVGWLFLFIDSCLFLFIYSWLFIPVYLFLTIYSCLSIPDSSIIATMCWGSKQPFRLQTRTKIALFTHARTHAYTHTRTHAHAHAYTRTHARTHAQIQFCKKTNASIPLFMIFENRLRLRYV